MHKGLRPYSQNISILRKKNMLFIKIVNVTASSDKKFLLYSIRETVCVYKFNT